MMRLNNGIWIAFGTLSLFCMSYLGFYKVKTSPHLDNMRSQIEVARQQKKFIHKQSRYLKKACVAHSQEESFLRHRTAELDQQNQNMYKQALDSKGLLDFYDNLTKIGTKNNVESVSMQSETIQLKGAAILNLTLSTSGTSNDLLSWLKDLEANEYPLALNHFKMTNRAADDSTLTIQISLLISE